MYDGDDYGDLVERARAGDRQAFRVLVRRTHVSAYRVAVRTLGDATEAEDVVQEAYVHAWGTLSELRDPGAARGWILAIVRNVALSRGRSNRRRRARIQVAQSSEELERLAAALVCREPLPEDVAATAQLGTTMWRMVDELAERYRVPLLLRVVDGMSYEEIGEALGLGEATVATRLRRARGRLTEKLERRLGVGVKVSA